MLISSDKAVRPTNVMGATKRWAELISSPTRTRRQDGEERPKVLRSSFETSSAPMARVVPLFKALIAKGGPVTVTDPDMTRYFMSIPEARNSSCKRGLYQKAATCFYSTWESLFALATWRENMIA